MTMKVFKLLIQFQSQRSRSNILETCLKTHNPNFFHFLMRVVRSNHNNCLWCAFEKGVSICPYDLDLIIFDPTPLVTLMKRNIVFVTEVLEQPGSETRVHYVVTILELHHANVEKQNKLLADVDVTPPRGAA